MSKFSKANFTFDGMYLMYSHNGKNEFIARFKHDKAAKGDFLKFLIANCEVEAYLGAMANGQTPVGYMETLGFVNIHSNFKKAMKKEGFPLTKEGFAAWRKKQEDDFKARQAAASFMTVFHVNGTTTKV